MEPPIHLGTWTDSGKKGERQRPSGSLSNTNESLWTRPGKGDRNQRFHRSTESTLPHSLDRYQNAVYWVRFSKGQDQGLELWQTKPFAIMTYAAKPRDCIDQIASGEGKQVLFERLETPRPAPKVTLNMNWHSKQQHQQHSTSHTDVPCTWKYDVKKRKIRLKHKTLRIRLPQGNLGRLLQT